MTRHPLNLCRRSDDTAILQLVFFNRGVCGCLHGNNSNKSQQQQELQQQEPTVIELQQQELQLVLSTYYNIEPTTKSKEQQTAAICNHGVGVYRHQAATGCQ